MVEGVAKTYTLRNFGNLNNCTLTALFPAVLAIHELTVGQPTNELSFNVSLQNTTSKFYINSYIFYIV